RQGMTRLTRTGHHLQGLLQGQAALVKRPPHNDTGEAHRFEGFQLAEVLQPAHPTRRHNRQPQTQKRPQGLQIGPGQGPIPPHRGHHQAPGPRLARPAGDGQAVLLPLLLPAGHRQPALPQVEGDHARPPRASRIRAALSGARTTTVPKMTRSTPRARAAWAASRLRMPPPSWTGTATAWQTRATAWPLGVAPGAAPERAPSRSTRWRRWAPAATHWRAASTGSRG